MTRNNLFLNKLLIITREGEVAYNEEFHKGVNIIRGDNSSGKSTITHFIFYVLGGAFKDWVPEARMCYYVCGEVEMNGATFTLKRYIEITKDKEGNERVNDKSAIYFFWGDLEESMDPPKEKEWQKFGYNTTTNSKSFSNVLFDNLDLPIVKGDNNITFHQILRLLYIDQDSPTGSLFLYEQFDSQITRETVSDLLLGVYSQELYDKKKRLVSADKELDDVKREIKITKQFFSDPLTLNPKHLRTQIDNKQKEFADKENEILQLKQESKQVEYKEETKLEFEKLKERALHQRTVVSKMKDRISELEYEIEDSDYFIETLEKKIKALKYSIETREFLGNFPLEYCPECLTKLKNDVEGNQCKLCKNDIDDSFGVVQARKMELEIGFQINESKKLLADNKRKFLELQAQFEAEEVALHQVQIQVNAAMEDVKSVTDEKIDRLHSDKGFIEGEIIQLRTLLENAELYEKLVKNKNELEEEVKFLKWFVWKTENDQAALKKKLNDKIETEGVYLLNNDLERQDEFKNANEFYIDYSNNIAFLSKKYSKYSASSNFYLKISARFALFFASLIIDEMRFPRFILADNMEDKGIEIERAQNLQKIIIDRLSEYNPDDYQVIYCTSYITEELEKSDFVVGEKYTKASPSLKNL
jgi:hypothetical protein